MSTGGCILLVEDDAIQQRIAQALLSNKLGYSVKCANHGREALSCLQAAPADAISAILLDIHMPVMNGFETLEHLRKYRPDIPVIMLTGEEDTAQAVRAIKQGAYEYLVKPVQSDQLEMVLQNAIRFSALTREVSRLRRDREGALSFHDLIGHDAGLAEVVNMGRKAAASDIPVLISGETGAGKELFARAIHGESRRQGAPFIAINCGAIPEHLVESTLFGHEKGAFTGAIARSIGKLREAEGGTLFLDEIGELPPDAQVKLLRALQQREVEPVGASRPVKVNIRLIAATHRDLQEEVRAGRFREDLFFRVHVLPITLPPLRQRPQDILPLAHYFIQRISASDMLPPRYLTPDAEVFLQRQPWPGNVREMENLLHRALVLSDVQAITPDLLAHLHPEPTPIDAGTAAQSSNVTIPGRHTNQSGVYIPLQDADGRYKTMQQLEQDAMEITLAQCGGNITQAAKRLGMAKSTFYRKLQA